MSELASILERTPVSQMADVRSTMRQMQAALPADDGVACFNRLYLAVTESVMEAEQGGAFADATFLSALDVAFGNLYFAALKDVEVGRAPPRAWAPLFCMRTRGDIAPVQFALAGMNAHINRDLPVGLVQTCATLGLDLSRPSPQSRDYDRVNEILATTEAKIAAEYFTPLMAQLHRHCDGLDDIVANWSVRQARAAAWINGAALWDLRAHPAWSAEYLDALDGIVGFAGRGLLVPTV
ncbi:MAG: hypothetical protein JOZ69_01610 [Myxococcales bacterium]|nr:hypothetical protein [Myxococcales bacterium]